MKVLLISPLPKIDPACGDIIYTETLLGCPPDGVVYETYAQAIERGALREHGTGRSLKRAVRDRRRVVGELARTTVYKLTNAARSRHLLFWEPFRSFSVRPGEYDLIHMHVFSARFLNLPCPLVVSNAAPVRSLYRDARRYSPARVSLMETAEQALGRMGGVNVVSYHLPQVSRVIAFTDFLKDWYVTRGIMPADRVDVVPIYLPNALARTPRGPNSGGRPMRVGFVAKDFEAKGGPVLLKAFERVRAVRPDAELVIVGCSPPISDGEAARRRIRWIPYIPREQLMSEIFPSFDVFAYPTEFDGMPLVVLEALALGVPVAISNYQAMPEMVANGRGGLISPVGDEGALAVNVLRLLSMDENARFSKAAREVFDQKFSSHTVKPRLGDSYQRAVAAQSRAHPGELIEAKA